MREVRRITSSERKILNKISRAARSHLRHQVDSLLENFSDNRAERKASDKSVDPSGIQDQYQKIGDIAAALTVWHTDPQFLTDLGTPKRLHKTGPLSLSTLARKIMPGPKESASLMRDLLDMGVIEEHDGLFLPAQRSAVLGRANAVTLAYAVGAVDKLIGTISHNIASADQRRYERQVADVRISAADLPMFLRFAEQQGQYLIDAVDDWLSKRQNNGKKSKTDVTVGLGAYCWVRTKTDAPRDQASVAKTKTRSRRR